MIRIRVEGVEEILRACRRLGPDAERELKRQARDIAETLADRIYYAGAADSRQSARAARSVRAVSGGAWPAIRASNSSRLLFGSEFGATRHFGWYSLPRYSDSFGKQFRPHLGGGSYWFFKTAEENQPWVESQWRAAADAVIRQWGA